jgi:hypothetical protein
MPSVAEREPSIESKRSEITSEYAYEKWMHWPVNWTAIAVGTLAAVAMVVVCGLIGVAIGAHVLAPENRVVDLKKIGLTTLAFSIFSSFLAFVIAGWVSVKIAGILRSEPAMLHGAIVWLATVPALIAVASLGAGGYMGGWHAGLAGAPEWAPPDTGAFDRPERPLAGAVGVERSQYATDLSTYRDQLTQWKQENARATRNSALGALSALLLGLMGSVIGGWMACGEPMTLTYHLTRPARRENRTNEFNEDRNTRFA